MSLPANPSLEHLRKQAKRLARSRPDLTLQQAQHQLATGYGFASWKALVDEVTARVTQGRLTRYLGRPVPMPGDLDPRYRPDALRAFLERLARETGHALLKISTDDSEYPPLVGAVMKGAPDHRWLSDAIDRLGGGVYVYGGCSSSRSGDGLRFALNLIPSSVLAQSPDDRTVFSRMMLRLEVLREEL